MTSESKILTVSYGTFSCTLEGFDNPFDTMKAIAEYFRDLAAQDRHFGAEPPQPDAAMLHRLAEREVSRLATSKAEEVGRMAPADPAETFAESPFAASVTPRIQFNPVNRRSAAPAPDAADAIAPDAAATEPSLQDVIPDGVAAKLARIRRSVHPTVAEAAPLTDFAADPEISGPAGLDPVETGADEDAPIAAILTELDATAELEATPDLTDAAEDVTARLGALIATDPAGYEDEDAADSFTASVWEPTVVADADPVAELASNDLDAAPIHAMSEAGVIFDSFVAEAELSDAADAEDIALLAELDGIAAEEAGFAASQDVLPEDMPQDYALADVALEDPLPEAIADVAPEAAEAEAYVETAAEAPAAEAAPEPTAPVAEEPAPPTGKSGRGRRSSRVIRLHPDATPDEDYDFGATRVLASSGESDEVARLMQQAEDVMAEDENRRRQEALSRLKAAVVATEADRADIDYEAPKADANLDPYRDDLAEAIQPPTEPEPEPEAEVKPTRRKSVLIRPATEPRPGTIRPGMISPPPLVLVSEQRIDRVIPASAPAPEVAPVATPAAAFSPAVPGLSPSAPAGQPMVALRTGRLSGAIGAGAAVAASGLPARNIVLDRPSYGPATDAEEEEDLAEDSREINEAGFASFAEMVGARSMAEMLEAAAAYATCVEKREQFTRPQLMRRMLASAGGKSVSREDGLRSFGTLLRTGRIEKITRGHYSLADNSPYLAEARRLA